MGDSHGFFYTNACESVKGLTAPTLGETTVITLTRAVLVLLIGFRMVAPVTGPFYTALEMPGPTTSLGYTPMWYRRSRFWYRQKKPYSMPLSWGVDIKKVLTYLGPNDNYISYGGAYLPPADDYANAHNSAYASFVSKIKGETSQLGTVQQSFDMIGQRSRQLFSVARSLRKLNFPEALSQLGFTSKPYKSVLYPVKGYENTLSVNRRGKKRWTRPKILVFDTRKTAKSFASNWLEISFGWKPLVNDIANAIDVTQRPYPSYRITGKGSANSRSTTVQAGAPVNNRWVQTVTNEVAEKIVSTVTISNPNLFRWNQLGLVNPATVAYELVPFSFVVNWFVNLESYLSSYTDFTGVTLTHPFTTVFARSVRNLTWTVTNVPPGTELGKVQYSIHAWEGVNVSRKTGMPVGPTLKVRPPWRLQPNRAANAVALLLQQLGHRSAYGNS